ncbi:type II toxin-antitoxin system VapC family toxin [Salinibacterium sp. ZJ454]|uniref:type II toxin-antitoxin system VapC family toxin n=1 Tax=Salinibacterium sp. ZJ454 TaxID=2708339 RepID=UPI00141FD7FE|nr:type II toxin-antitoxin system VapC family toxin [Salinibacterium sp. ZJ454]
MIVDSSALIAIARQEPDAATYARALARSEASFLSAANYVEAAIVVDRSHDPIASRAFDDLLSLASIRIEPVTVEQARIARDAYRDFGKGSGHPAGLNFGDCVAYALAKDRGQPLLFKGDDFSQTDVQSALDS